jgi:4-hydroxy-tetrahydrodipicolinate synthase
MIPKQELKRWAKEYHKGIENTLFPSFTPDMQALDEDGIRLDVRQSIAHGFTSMMCATEVGLRFDEAKRFVQIAAEEAGDKIRVTASLLFDNFDEQFEMLEWGEKVGLHGYLLGFPPSYHPETSEEIYVMAKKMCDATNLAITVYPSPHFNFQRFHPAGYPLDVLARLADVPNVIAMKVGEHGLYAALHHLVGDRVLLGSPVERETPLLMMGFGMQWMGAGCYEVFQSPEQPYMVEYFNLLLEGKRDAAMDLYWRLTPARVIFEQQFNATVMTGTYHWSQQKYYQWCVGGNGGVVRQPSMKLHQHEMDMTKMGYYQIGINPRQPDAEFYVGRLNFEKMHATAGKTA